LERTYSIPRNEVIEAAISVLETYPRVHVRYSFNQIDAGTTQVVVVVHDVTLTELDRQKMSALIFDELEQRLLFKNQGALRNQGFPFVN
jgi:hypothetical protein